MRNKFGRFFGRDLPPDGITIEQIKRRRRGIFRKDFGVTRIVWVGGGMSVLDAVLLAIYLECVPEQGDAENSQDGGQWTVDSYQ